MTDKTSNIETDPPLKTTRSMKKSKIYVLNQNLIRKNLQGQIIVYYFVAYYLFNSIYF
jgi:hypothetical protein